MNQPYAMLMLAWTLQKVLFGKQLYWSSARPTFTNFEYILNLDWLLHARNVQRVYEWPASQPRVKLPGGLILQTAPAQLHFVKSSLHKQVKQLGLYNRRLKTLSREC